MIHSDSDERLKLPGFACWIGTKAAGSILTDTRMITLAHFELHRITREILCGAQFPTRSPHAIASRRML